MLGFGFKDMERRGDPNLVPHEKDAWITADSNHGEQSRVAIDEAHKAGMHTYLLDFVRDGEPVPKGCWWQSSTSWVGWRGRNTDNTRWVTEFAQRNECNAILTDGENGLYFARPNTPGLHLPAIPINEKIVDTTGAGDVFRAGMLHGLSHHWKISDCLVFSSAAAALNCQGLGATGGLASEERILQFVQSMKEVAQLYDQADESLCANGDG